MKPDELIKIGQGTYCRGYTPSPYFIPPQVREAGARLWARLCNLFAVCKNEVCDNEVEDNSDHPDFCDGCSTDFPHLMQEVHQANRLDERDSDRLAESREAR